MSLPKVGLATIHRILGDPIAYTGLGLTAAPLTAIHAEVAIDAFASNGKTNKRVTFEIQRADLPGKPEKRDGIVHESGSWRVIEIDPEGPATAWLVSVERAA